MSDDNGLQVRDTKHNLPYSMHERPSEMMVAFGKERGAIGVNDQRWKKEAKPQRRDICSLIKDWWERKLIFMHN